MAPTNKTVFNENWLADERFQHIERTSNNVHAAYCKICHKIFELSNMGVKALISHIKGKKHCLILKNVKAQNVLNMSIAWKTKIQESLSEKIEENKSNENLKIGGTQNLQLKSNILDSSALSSVDLPTPSSNKLQALQSLISTYTEKDQVIECEITWCLQVVVCHIPISTASKCTKVFSRMFPDSKIAANMKLGRTKISYNIVYGLAPFFKNIVLKEAMDSSCFVISFDESLNKSSQKQQMDVALRFWCNSTQSVCNRYLNSAFLGHTTAVDLLKGFLEATEGLDLKHLLQISMDGPNVNLKFLRELENHIRTSQDPNTSLFLQMGSCGLHVVHNSFKTGDKATNWGIVSFMRCCYNIFKDVPARRSDYCRYSGSNELPKKFCAVRWLQNADVAERCLKIIPNLKKFIEGAKRDKLDIKSESYKVVCKKITDNFLGVKLSFFVFVARKTEKFLQEFQSDVSLAPFLYTNITNLMMSLLEIFVKDEILNEAISLQSIDLNDNKNLKPTKSIKLGHSVRAELRKVNGTEAEILLFKKSCCEMIKAMCIKLMEKSPIKYKLCKGITFLDPTLMSSFGEKILPRLDCTLRIFMERNWLTGIQCDSIADEFKLLVAKPTFLLRLKNYNRQKERLDTFWINVLIEYSVSNLLKDFVKKILILSHGNAFVERGFSINKELVIENQLNKSLVSQRQVYDAVLAADGLQNVQITKEMKASVRKSRSLYGEIIATQKKNFEAEKNARLEKQQNQSLLKELLEKKTQVFKELEEIESEIIKTKLASE